MRQKTAHGIFNFDSSVTYHPVRSSWKIPLTDHVNHVNTRRIWKSRNHHQSQLIKRKLSTFQDLHSKHSRTPTLLTVPFLVRRPTTERLPLAKSEKLYRSRSVKERAEHPHSSGSSSSKRQPREIFFRVFSRVSFLPDGREFIVVVLSHHLVFVRKETNSSQRDKAGRTRR